MSDYQKSPITGHACFKGPECDLWHRKDNVTITCGSYGPPDRVMDLLRPPSPDTYPCGHSKTPGDDICSNLECNGHLMFE